jgi:hypothetical protein
LYMCFPCFSPFPHVCFNSWLFRLPLIPNIMHNKGVLITKDKLNHVFLLVKLMWSLRKFYGRHHDLVYSYGIHASQMTTDIFHLS